MTGLANRVIADAGHSRDDPRQHRKGADWKVKLALDLRREHGAACTWLAKALSMGSPSAVRSLLSRAKSFENQHSAGFSDPVGLALRTDQCKRPTGGLIGG